MWIILLDHSSSMASGFENEPKTGRLAKASDADTRLGAAKEVLLELLTRWSPQDQVLLVPFTSTVRRIGPFQAGQRTLFENELASIQPTNGTDIAAALNAAADEVEKAGTRATVFLISDGQSNHEEALAAAARCDALRMTVCVYVIDPDEQSETLALRIAGTTGGSWERVVSRTALQGATLEAVARTQAQAKAAAEMVERFEQEYHEVEAQRHAGDEVLFTAAHPRRIAPKKSYPLYVAVHHEGEQAAVEQNLKNKLERNRLTAQLTSREALKRLPRGTVLEIEPRLPEMLVSPRRAEVVWLGTATIVDFEIRTLSDEIPQGFVEGNVEITTQHGFLIGRTPITLKIAKDSDEKPELPELAVGALINRVFASYAHVDDPVIMACREVYKGLGIQLFVDHEDIHGGEFWREALAMAIGSCDLFQLFWSTASASSQEVRNEWSQALQIVPQKHRHFVRPVYWQQRKPVPDPPEQLSGIQFRYLDLSFMEIDEKKSGVRPAGAGSTIVAPLELENQLTILPLVQNCDSTLELVRKEMGRVVAFLEAVTGLRYIPAPTLLVDHYAVRSVREKITVDKQKQNAGSNPPASEHEWAILLLRSLLLAFHNGDVRQLLDYRNATEFFGFANILELGDFQHIARVSEAGIRKLIEDLLAGREVKSNDGSNAIEKALADPKWGTRDLDRYLAHLVAVCYDDNDRQDLEQRFSRWLRAEGAVLYANIKEQDVSSVVQKMQEAKVKDIRQRYSAGVYPLLEQERTTLCRTKDVKSYLRRCLELVEDYAKRILLKRGDVEVRGYFPLEADVFEHAKLKLNLNLVAGEAERDWSNPEQVRHKFSLKLSHYCDAIQRLREYLLKAIAAVPTRAQRLRHLAEVTVPTYGICVTPGDKAVEAQIVSIAKAASWPGAVALPGTTKILVAQQAIDELRAELTAIGEPASEIDAKVSGLLRAVLAHEHFHSNLAYGLDRFGRSAGAIASVRVWDRGRNLNEALAAWMEMHLTRSEPWLFDRVTEWVTAGDYPAWPYRGALNIENLYKEHGLQAIRDLIMTFRADPQLAQERFNSLRAVA